MCLMAIEASPTHLVGEGQSIVRPPLFNGENYAYWKTRMRQFIQANDYKAWRVIVNGPTIPTKIMGDEEKERDANDIKIAQLNGKVMHILFCALGASEYTSLIM